MKLRVRAEEDRSDRLARIENEAAERAEAERRRREVLIDCVVTAVPAAILSARSEAWNEGWEAARRGLPKTANPARPITN